MVSCSFNVWWVNNVVCTAEARTVQQYSTFAMKRRGLAYLHWLPHYIIIHAMLFLLIVQELLNTPNGLGCSSFERFLVLC